jgi:ribonuclease P protein component
MEERFPREHRILRKAEFREVFDHGRSRSDDRLIVYALPRDSGGPNRIGLVVGRRYGGAVRRNRWKRRLREAFRLNRAALPASHDLVVLPAKRGLLPDPEGARSSLVALARLAAKAVEERGPR